MSSRRNMPSPYDERECFRIPSGLVHPDEPLPSHVLLEDKLMSQEVEIEQLVKDNNKLASSHLALRQDLIAAQQEADKLRDHIRSIQAEGDIQIRILLDKIAKAEADISAREDIKKELQEAHIEAQRLETTRQELTAKIQHATKEFDNLHEDLKRFPEMLTELNNSRQEHQRLRNNFECEKAINTEKVEQMKTLEKDLIRKAEEVEELRAEVSNAERRANVSAPPFPRQVGCVDSFDRPHGGGYTVAPPGVSIPVDGAASGNPSWGGTYDASGPQPV